MFGETKAHGGCVGNLLLERRTIRPGDLSVELIGTVWQDHPPKPPVV
jgi:hypothetical protein